MFQTMVEYGERLDMAMRECGMSTRELADGIGVSYQAVKKVIDGKSTAFSAANNSLAAEILKVSPDWLATGQGHMRPLRPLWPFPSIDEQKVRALGHDDLVRLDAALLFAAAQIGLDVAIKKDQSAVA